MRAAPQEFSYSTTKKQGTENLHLHKFYFTEFYFLYFAGAHYVREAIDGQWSELVSCINGRFWTSNSRHFS